MEKIVTDISNANTQRMDGIDSLDAPSVPLFHYTTWEGFEGILKSRSFWFTSVYQMNDDRELMFGLGLAHGILRTALLEASTRDPQQPVDWLIREFCNPLAAAEILDAIKARFEFYSASFGQRDEPHQWREYAKGGTGVAIGVSEALFKPKPTANAAPFEHNFLAKVTYGAAACEKRHRIPIQEALDMLTMAAQRGFFTNGVEAAEFCRRLAAGLHVPLIANSIATKEAKWEPEKETRLYFVNDLTRPRLTIRTRPSDGRRYVDIPLPLFNPSMFTEVIIGPNAEPDAEQRVKALLGSLGLPAIPAVMRSKVAL